MAINEWKIWQMLGLAKAPEKEYIDVEGDLKAVTEFLEGVNGNVKSIQKLLKSYAELRKEEIQLREEKADEKALRRNIAEQVRIYDKVLRAYEYFDLDTDISAERIKKISRKIRQNAEELVLEEKLMSKIRTEERWTYNW
jgi:hypothetical protein